MFHILYCFLCPPETFHEKWNTDASKHQRLVLKKDSRYTPTPSFTGCNRGQVTLPICASVSSECVTKRSRFLKL